MATETVSAPLTPDPAWSALVTRSIRAWDTINAIHEVTPAFLPRDALLQYKTLEDLLILSTQHIHFWFFQLRSSFMSQGRLIKWSPDRLKEYVILPAMPGFAFKSECFFLSHFWDLKDHPDPSGKYLRLNQAVLQAHSWSFIWVDWTCIPQDPRTELEARFFERTLRTMSALIRNCGFMYYYPPFRPRLWILYEVAEYMLTSEDTSLPTEDAKDFAQHVDEMLELGVQPVLSRYGYRCSQERDKQYLTSWLGLLVLLNKLKLPIPVIRRLLEMGTWHGTIEIWIGENILLKIYDGTLTVHGVVHNFEPFPRWNEGKYALPEHIRQESAEGRARKRPTHAYLSCTSLRRWPAECVDSVVAGHDRDCGFADM